MELSLWTYEGPPHVGAMRIATSMRDVHYVLHAPQGDTYADLLFTMIERHDKRPPVTYTTFQARDLGADTANLLKSSIRDAFDRFQPQALMVGESCTAELIQDQPGSLAKGMDLPVPVVPLELPSYSKKENWGASESFYYLVRHVLAHESSEAGLQSIQEERNSKSEQTQSGETRRPTANLLGPTSLGFRCRDDVVEISRLLEQIGVQINVIAPLHATTDDLRKIPAADFNISLYPEVSRTLCRWLERSFKQPTVNTVPIGVSATLEFIEEIEALTGIDASEFKNDSCSRLPWYSRSVDSTYLTGKRVFIFADGTHAIAAARIARDELGFEVVGLGTFSREMAKDVRAKAQEMGLEALISDDYLEVEQHIESLQPELVLGTQMERHIAKRLNLPCAVISTPVHVQDFPARYSPQMGYEGANVIFDAWVHPLIMGLEEHLLHMFRDDFEFNDSVAPSHLHGGEHQAVNTDIADEAKNGQANAAESLSDNNSGHDSSGYDSSGYNSSGNNDLAQSALTGDSNGEQSPLNSQWAQEAEAELKKIPFFVRGKARRNTEAYARMRGETLITLDTLYDAKAHYAR
ncbi:MAG: ferredoxin:protochlorophyllide reductase (ATP-dependent) subunit B [Granulosicoccus sp.]|nr:ferredoxin:protochlorophyllide reductase (ATP-dependent) subunit B [Granulosicoccus sp.]